MPLIGSLASKSPPMEEGYSRVITDSNYCKPYGHPVSGNSDSRARRVRPPRSASRGFVPRTCQKYPRFVPYRAINSGI